MKEFTCIVCPKGCTLVYHDDGTVTGNTCSRGKDYAVSEATNPVRFVTSTVACIDGRRCPVRTSRPIAKGKMMDVMAEIRKINVKTAVVTGDVLVSNIAGTEADLIATGSAGGKF